MHINLSPSEADLLSVALKAQIKSDLRKASQLASLGFVYENKGDGKGWQPCQVNFLERALQARAVLNQLENK